jgi:hypothetical protein
MDWDFRVVGVSKGQRQAFLSYPEGSGYAFVIFSGQFLVTFPFNVCFSFPRQNTVSGRIARAMSIRRVRYSWSI